MNAQIHPLGTSLDHLMPKDQGGPDSLVNCVIACFKCNSERRSTSPALYISYQVMSGFTPRWDLLQQKLERLQRQARDTRVIEYVTHQMSVLPLCRPLTLEQQLNIVQSPDRLVVNDDELLSHLRQLVGTDLTTDDLLQLVLHPCPLTFNSQPEAMRRVRSVIWSHRKGRVRPLQRLKEKTIKNP